MEATRSFIRGCLDFYFSSLITSHSIFVTCYLLLITHHLKYHNFPNPTHLAHIFNFSSLKIFYCLWDPLPKHMSVSIVSLPASLNSSHFIFFSSSHHCPVTLPTQTQTQIAWHVLIPYEGTDSHSAMQQCVVKKS